MAAAKEVMVSVVVPNFNHAKYLRQRLDSILNQTYRDFELILLDDCSTDDSVEVMNGYKDHPAVSHIIVNSENSGSTFKQWKKGIELAAGKWIWIAESDDWCEPVFLEKLMANVDEQVAFAFCQTYVVNQALEVIWKTDWPRPQDRIPGKQFIEEHLSRGNCIVNASMCLFNKTMYQSVSLDFMKYKFIGDWLFWVELSERGDVVVISERLNYFRKHDKDVSGRAYREGLGYLEYFALLDTPGGEKILPPAKRKKIARHKYYEFLNDPRIENSTREKLHREFRDRIGISSYYYQVKNFLVKKIKNPLLRGFR